MKFNSTKTIISIFSLLKLADLRLPESSRSDTYRPTFSASSVPYDSQKVSVHDAEDLEEDYDSSENQSYPIRSDSNKAACSQANVPCITSYNINIFSVLSEQLSFAIIRDLLNDEDFVYVLRELTKHMSYNRAEIDSAIDEISSRITLKDIRDLFSQNINGERVPRPAEEILGMLSEAVSFYCAEFPVLEPISYYLNIIVEIAQDRFSRIVKNDSLADIYDEKYAETIFKLFLVNLYNNNGDASIPIFSREAEKLLSKEQKKELSEKVIEYVKSGLDPTNEQRIVVDNIRPYFLNLAQNILSLSNHLISALNEKDDEKVDYYFDLLMEEFKMFHVYNYGN
ncbi:uncharacterized protein VICG_01935 [Vittaforma corneae ATCC 50505]|uniref:Uncharacterized protein n=1 Tax=Vittaforma corneae (strain ATCC 50505) TaxID=993615 RepID=L2GJK3_VITCO|nr:uncharacterized protein VICG_01935 [Vittaforma corneae ATCC 50505]ELA41053.1 hypothetical protein VICG_01935 [Vittaforma corneae ATCC 50505]